MTGDDGYEYVKVIALLGFFFAFGCGVFVWNRNQRTSIKEADDERKKAIEHGVKQGILNEYGEPLCVVCKQVATKNAVRTGRSWIDSIPILSLLNKLYSMPWRYTVVEDQEGGHRYCAAHRRAAEQRLEQMHARMRSDHAAFNASQQQKIAMLDQGGLDQLLREDTEVIQREIGLSGSMRRSLDSRGHITTGEADKVHVLPVRSTGTVTEAEHGD